MVDDPDPSVPRIGRDNSRSPLEPLIGRPTINHNHLPIRRFNHGAIALAGIEKREPKPVPVKPQPRRPNPPQKNDCDTFNGCSPNEPFRFEPYR